MTRLGHLVKGLAALGLLAAVAAGIPFALWHVIGWPLPHRVPSAAQVGHALTERGIADQSLVDALAVVVWITWAVLVASIVAEVPAALRGRSARRLPLAGIFQPLAGRLVAAVLVAALSFAPRATHGAAGSLAAGLPTSAHRPVAALVLTDPALRDTVLTDATTRLPPTPGPVLATTRSQVGANARASIRTGTSPAAPADDAPPRTYVVQRGDTLWAIAERECGDPLAWRAIYALNEGRTQADGQTLTSPHWIDPGWTLLLPPAAGPAPTAAGRSVASTPAPASPTVTSPTVTSHAAAPTTAPAPATATPTTSAPTHHPRPATGSANDRRHEGADAPVRLPSGSIVGGSLAAGVLAAVALGRLRRRHAYRYRPPAPGRNLGAEPLPPTLRRLAAAVRTEDDDEDEPAPTEAVPAMADEDPEHRERPDLLALGTRDGETVHLALTELAGVALSGPDADDVARAVVAALLVRAGPVAAEVWTTRAVLDRLAPGCGGVPGVRVVAGPAAVLGHLEAEALARARLLDGAENPDLLAYRRANPWEPVPTIVAVLDRLPDKDGGRWAALLATGPRLGLAALLLDPDDALPVRLDLDAEHGVIAATPAHVADHLVGARLFALRTTEAAEVLAALAEAEERPASDDPEAEDPATDDSSTRDEAEGESDTDAPIDTDDAGTAEEAPEAPPTPPPAPVAEPWPAGDAVARPDPPVAIRLLGPVEVRVGGEIVAKGLRTPAKELLAWYVLRPEGTTIDAAVDALWPDTAPAQVHRQFWTGASNLRTRLGGACEPPTKLLVQVGAVYRLDPDAIACDLWQFQAALRDAARATDEAAARGALRRAVELCRGDLAQGTDFDWIEPARQDLHRRMLDAHLRLAELEERCGATDAAEAVLDHAVEFDRYAEEPYRRLMALQGERGRPDAVASTWRLLQRRLAEIDVDPEPATLRCYRSLTTDTGATSRRRGERAS